MLYNTVTWKHWFSGVNYELHVPWIQATFPPSYQDQKAKEKKQKINAQNTYTLRKLYLAKARYLETFTCGYIDIFTKESKKTLEDLSAGSHLECEIVVVYGKTIICWWCK